MSTPSANVRAATIFSSPIFSAGESLDTQAVLHFLKSVSLGFWIEEKDDEELQHHHRPEKYEGIRAGRFRKLRKRISNDGVHDPVRRAPHALSLGAHAARKHLAYVHPNYRTLRNGKEGDVGDEEHKKITLVAIRKEHPGDTKKARGGSDGSNQQKSFASQLIDDRHAQQRGCKIHPADSHGLQIAGHLAVTGRGKNVIQIVKNGVDAGKLVEHANGNREKKREAIFPGKKRLGSFEALEMNRVDDLAQLRLGIFRTHHLEHAPRLVHSFLSNQPARACGDAEEQHEKKHGRKRSN